MLWVVAWIGVVVIGAPDGESEPWFWAGVALMLPVVCLVAWKGER
jgi:hypothetical protein